MTLLRAEMSLLLRRRPLWWYAVVLILWFAALIDEPLNAVNGIVPLAWLCGITGFSERGARAEIRGTRSLLASAASPLLRQLPLQWLAAAVFALILVAPVLLKLLLAGAMGTPLQILIGAGFVSALSLALGALSGVSRLFELGFLILWYAAMNGAPGARFSGNAQRTFSVSCAPTYPGLGVLLLIIVWLLRGWALRR